jgi:hypothetical protein
VADIAENEERDNLKTVKLQASNLGTSWQELYIFRSLGPDRKVSEPLFDRYTRPSRKIWSEEA